MNQDITGNRGESFAAEEIVEELRGGLLLVTLNRPRALNALSLGMIMRIRQILARCRDDDRVRCILFVGAGDRAFCAGGDIKSFHEYGLKYKRGEVGLDVPAGYFGQEYAMNSEIYHYPKPVIAFMNGITMGGGYGIAGNSRYRIVTDRTMFAMPEVGIGFFPDVGSIYHLLRFRGAIGRYLALTGAFIAAEDALYAGVGEYYVAEERLNDLVEALSDCDAVDPVLERFSEPSGCECELMALEPEISEIFSAVSVDDIVDYLEVNGSKWAQKTLEMIRSKSPLSIAVTAEYLRRAEGWSIDDVLAQDFALAQKFIEDTDLYEGIYAAVIDREHRPVWSPSALAEVTPDMVEAYFAPPIFAFSEALHGQPK